MPLLTNLQHRIRALFLKRKLDRDLADELEMHLELETRKYVAAGVSPDEARRRARIALGGTTQAMDECRDARGINLLENVARDCRYALRAFRRSPVFASTIVLIMAIAIGANTTVFSFCHAILLAQLPIPDPQRLFLATLHFGNNPETRFFSYPDLQQMKTACKPAQLTGFTDTTDIHLLDNDGTTGTIKGQLVTEDFFSTLKMSPLLGRNLTLRDNRPGTENVGVLSYHLWSTRFASNPSVIGQRITIQHAELNIPVVLYTALTTLVCGLLVSLLPALRASQSSFSGSLGQRTETASAPSSRLAGALITVQLAFSLASLTVAGLLVHTLVNYSRVDLGMDRTHTLSVGVDPSAAGYSGAERQQALYRRLTAEINRIPGVLSSSVAGCGVMNNGCAFIDASVIGTAQKPITSLVERNYVGPDYFATVGIQLLRGRTIRNTDRSGSQLIAVVNHSFEQQVLHGASALGRQIRTDSDGRAATIVGVVSDARSDNIHRAPGPFVYLPVIQAGSWNISSIEVRTAGDPKTVAVSIRSTIAGIDRAIPVAQIVTLSEETNRGLAREFLLGRLSAVFSVLTLLIAAIGLYGLFAYRVSQRRGELAIRMTLGATRSSLLQQVLVQAFRIWTVGCLAGLALSGIAGRLVRSLLFGIGPMDIWSHAASIALLFLVSIVAVSVPAWKAATVDPVSALKTN